MRKRKPIKKPVLVCCTMIDRTAPAQECTLIYKEAPVAAPRPSFYLLTKEERREHRKIINNAK